MSQKTLVAYFSKGGAAAKYAHVIAETLEARGFPVDQVDLHVDRTPDLQPYENVVIGTGIRVGIVYRMGKRILRRPELKEKRVAVFLASGIAVTDAPRARRRFLEPLMKRFGLTPIAFQAFAGMLPGGEGLKLVDNTDPAAARKWASDLADLLLAAEKEA